jgi:hypothetical protein
MLDSMRLRIATLETAINYQDLLFEIAKDRWHDRERALAQAVKSGVEVERQAWLEREARLVDAARCAIQKACQDWADQEGEFLAERSQMELQLEEAFCLLSCTEERLNHVTVARDKIAACYHEAMLELRRLRDDLAEDHTTGVRQEVQIPAGDVERSSRW